MKIEKVCKDAEYTGSRGVIRDDDSASFPDSSPGISIRDTHRVKNPGCNVILSKYSQLSE